MAKPAVRLQALEVALLAGLGVVVLRAGQVQLLQGTRYAEEARSRRTERITLQARRGGLYDRNGSAIALTQETYHVGIAPNELRDPSRDATTIARALRLSPDAVRAELRKRYAYFGGPFAAVDVQKIRDLHGVHLEPVLRRLYAMPDFARAVVGGVGSDGHGASGLEKFYDTLLAGRDGAAVVLKDRSGREYESPSRLINAPVPGGDIVLTLDAELQEIAQQVLSDALRQLDAAGGDIVILDPKTGELLAVASRRRDGSTRPSAFTDTYEPGSLAKIFAASALLSLHRIAPTDHVSGEGGRYRLAGRPTVIEDDHPMPTLTLAQAIEVSSNIAMAKFITRVNHGEQYVMLRDFGLGAPTGVEFPSESPGRLRRPAEWSGTSAVSLAIGYEVAVTPLQLAAAYGAIANDGILLVPALVREVRDPEGEVLYGHRPEPVRRVVSAALAKQLRGLLRGVVEHGTGTGVTIANFGVAAKTGTARRTVNGHYAPGEYVASLATLFPADDPQLVIVVKIDDPDPKKKGYFASQTAAPVTRALLEQALASRTMTLNQARIPRTPAVDTAPEATDDGAVPYVVPWPFRPDTTGRRNDRQLVPDVSGQALRAAVRTLHRRGFRVALRGWGVADHTSPAAGSPAATGSVITLYAAESR